jgi:predicted metal-binding protein
MPIKVVPADALRYAPEVRGLCVKPYELHPRGCPNFGKKVGCPPKAPHLPVLFDLAQPSYVIYNVFDFGAHVAKMRALHPTWSKRQVECCLYWQGTARSALRAEIKRFTDAIPEYIVTSCPEAMGLDVTTTMRALGVELEWPPQTRAVQVAFAGRERP